MIFTFADFELDTDRCELRRGGRRVHVEPQVFDVLAELLRAGGRVVSRDDLLDRVWGHRFVTDATVSSRVMAARRALGDSGSHQRFIATVRGRGFRFVGEIEEREPAAVQLSSPAQATPGFVGRRDELRRLRTTLTEVLAGERRTVLVTGEAGAGKTALVQQLRAEAAAVPRLRWAEGQCIAHRGAGEPYLPVLEALGRLCRADDGGEVVAVLRRTAPMWLVHLPWLLTAEDRRELEPSLLGATRERMLREMVEALEELARIEPLALVVEDAHWSDPSTLDLLTALVRRAERARLLVVVTLRTTDASQPEPMRALLRDVRRAERCRQLALGPLAREEVSELLVAESAEPELAELLAGPLHAQTDGNPLFVRSVLDDWQARGVLARDDGRLVLRDEPDRLRHTIPDDVRELVEGHLAQLGGLDQELLEAGSVAGVTFSAALAAAGLGEDVHEVERRADRLARDGRWLRADGAEAWPDGTLAERYAFVHHLHREVLYERLPAGRRARLHVRVGRRLEAAHGAGAAALAPELAMHFLGGHDHERAVRWLRAAAERAVATSAHREAVIHVRTGLQLLAQHPDLPDAAHQELALQSVLAPSVVATEGWRAPEAERAYRRAKELCEVLGRRDRLSDVLYGLATLLEFRGEYPASQELIERRLGLPVNGDADGDVVASRELLACSLFHQGAFAEALEHAEAGLRAYRAPDRHPEASAIGEHPAVNCHGWAGLSLCFLGQRDEALQRAQAGVALARDPSRRFSLANALVALARLHQQRGEPAAALAAAQEAEALAGEWGFAYVGATAAALAGWADVRLGEHDRGLDRLRHAIDAHEATGARMDRPYYLGLLADACLTAGRRAEAADAVERALASLTPPRRFFYEDELRRLAALLGEDALSPPARPRSAPAG